MHHLCPGPIFNASIQNCYYNASGSHLSCLKIIVLDTVLSRIADLSFTYM